MGEGPIDAQDVGFPSNPFLTRAERYAEMAKALTEALGLSQKLGDQMTAELSDTGLKLGFKQGSLAPLSHEPGYFAAGLDDALRERFKHTKVEVVGGGYGNQLQEGEHLSLSFAPGTSENDVKAAVDMIVAAQKAAPRDVTRDGEANARKQRVRDLGERMVTLFDGAARVPLVSNFIEIPVTKGEPEATLQALKNVFKDKFQAPADALTLTQATPMKGARVLVDISKLAEQYREANMLRMENTVKDAAGTFRADVDAAAALRAAPVPSEDERYASYGKALAESLGLTKQFGDTLKLDLDERRLRVSLNEEALKKLPASMRLGIAEELGRVVNDKFKVVPSFGKAYQMGIVPDGKSTDFTIVFKDDLKEAEVRAGLEQVMAAQKAAPADLIAEATQRAQLRQYDSYSDVLKAAFGAQSSARDSGKPEVTQIGIDKDRTVSAEAIERVKALFKQHFDIAGDAFVVGEKKAGSEQAITVNVAAIAAYDKKFGEHAFAKKFESKAAEFKTALAPVSVAAAPATNAAGAVAPGTAPTPVAPPKERGFLDILNDNKGMGLAGLIGAVIGFFAGGAPLALVGLFLGGGAGALADGKKGLLGLGSAGNTPEERLTPKLLKEITTYAQLHSTDFSTGITDVEKVKKMVADFSNGAAKDMTAQEQDQKADMIAAANGQIKTQISTAGAAAAKEGLEKAMQEAMNAMRSTDYALQISTQDISLVPSGKSAGTAEGVRKAAQVFR